MAARCTMLTNISVWTRPKAKCALLDDLLDTQMIVANMCSVYEVFRSMHIWTELLLINDMCSQIIVPDDCSLHEALIRVQDRGSIRESAYLLLACLCPQAFYG